MPSAVAEAEAAAMDNAVGVWRLNTASRLHMVCTWWEWKCSESNWQTIALDSDECDRVKVLCGSLVHIAG